jgi:predicted helicase
LAFLNSVNIAALQFDVVKPNTRHDWINVAETDFDKLLPFISRDAKEAAKGQERAIFKLYTLGISTNRDDWIYDLDKDGVKRKIKFFLETYDRVDPATEEFPEEIKWSETLKRRKAAGQQEKYDPHYIQEALCRPFVSVWSYQSHLLIDRPGSADELRSAGKENRFICFIGDATEKPFSVIAARGLDLNFLSAAAAGTKIVPLYRNKFDNVTDWAQRQFGTHYDKGKPPKRSITKDAIFHYVYGILHDPIYRRKYALNLKREFSRIPFYADFWKWAEWGEKLVALHIGYEMVEPWPLERTDTPDVKSRKAGLAPKAMLKADKDAGTIRLDSETQLTGVPPEAWNYRLGNRSALEWILDQYKEKTPKDPTIREKFNTYRFADHKEKVIDLLKRVTRVSVETMKIIETMNAEKR